VPERGRRRLQLAYFADPPTRSLLTVAALGSPPQIIARHIEVFQADVRGLLLDLRVETRLRPDVDVDLLAGPVIAGITSVAPHVLSRRQTAVEARTYLIDLLLHGALTDDGG